MERMCQYLSPQIAARRDRSPGVPAPYDVAVAETSPRVAESASFLESLMDTELYSIGAFFCDEHPELVDELVARSDEIERRGLEAYSADADGPIEETFETLLTGLAVRYYKAVAG
jgi:hypothetical protein